MASQRGVAALAVSKGAPAVVKAFQNQSADPVCAHQINVHSIPGMIRFAVARRLITLLELAVA